MLISLVLAVAVTILAVFFATHNLTVIDVNLFGYPLRGTTGVIMVVTLVLGVLLGVMLMLPALISRSWALMRHKRKLQDLQSAVQQKQFEDTNEE